jgi:hypothetical protein
MKFDSEKIIYSYSMSSYDYTQFPFIIAQSKDGMLHIMQITTGKTRSLKYKSPLSDNYLGEQLEGSRLMVQIDNEYLIVSSDQG